MHIEPNHEECEECGEQFIPPSADALWIVDAIDANGRETRDMIDASFRRVLEHDFGLGDLRTPFST